MPDCERALTGAMMDRGKERSEGVAALCRRFRVATLYGFGSRGHEALDWLHGRTGEMTGESDLDVGVRPVPGHVWTVDDKVGMAIALEDLAGCGRVDLVVLSEADPFLAAEIIRGERLYAQDEHDADEYDLYVLRRAGDLMPLEQERIALVLQSRTT